MATIDLGKIKLVWRGTYSGGTAYTVDDVVQHTDSGITSSFICTTASTGNAPSTGGSVHSSWAYLAKGGSAGTDVGTTITTQGDILYRDGSGLQRLAAGTSGQFLKTQGSGANPVWADSGGKTLAFTNYQQNSRVALSSSTSATSLMSGAFTQAKANSKLLIHYKFVFFMDASGASRTYFTYDGTTTYEHWSWDYRASSTNVHTWSGHFVVDGVNGTGSKNWVIGWHSNNSSATRPAEVFCPNASDDARVGQTVSQITIHELDF
mgnify:CR=1 FL=1|tara:strand:+ start:772 stop:1563 length:792 start_codon:yes stop_codon:yes gene_type:complete